jgi:triphosphoribosyl-dephospho-CoA synthase
VCERSALGMRISIKKRRPLRNPEYEFVSDVPKYISRCLQLAVLLEVSAYPKPGNVHRTADFAETRYEHFLASAVAVSPHFERAAQRGQDVFYGKIELSQINVGATIKDAVSDVAVWQRDKNTLLGSILLLSPMAAAAGLTITQKSPFSTDTFRRNLASIVESTTPRDAVNVYDAIELASPGGLGKTSKFDVTDAQSKQKILSSRTSLYDIFMISAPWDSISAEWVNGFHVTFDIGYPYFKQEIKETRDINTASVNTFLKILSIFPDTLITRKAGKAKARWVSKEAKKVLDKGGLSTEKGKEQLIGLDRKLHDVGHRLNPGTTADITSAVLALALLQGYRP